jgi:NitT/TauT family transport system permease protein
MFVGADFLPGPVETYHVLLDGIESGWVVSNTITTLEAALYAYLFAVVTGLTFGLAVGSKRLGYDLFEPLIVTSYAIPKLTFYPIFLFIFGIGLSTKVTYAGFSAFFPMALLTMRAVQSVNETHLKIGQSANLSRYQMFRHIIFPSTLVQIVVALRLTFSSMFVSLIIAELFVSRAGLGLVIQHAMGVFDIQRIFAVTVILFVIAFIVNAFFYEAQSVLERRWNMTAEEMQM